MKFPNTEIEYVTLDDGRLLYLSGRGEPSPHDIVQPCLFIVIAEDNIAKHEEFLLEDDGPSVFETLCTHEEKQAKARAILGEAWESNWSEKLLREAIEQAFAALEGETQ